MIKRPWLDKADWQSWTEFIEIKINSIECNTASELWNAMLEIIQESTEKFIPTKYLSPHSKPFWNDELKKASEDLRLLRKHFRLNSNYSNGNRLKIAKNEFQNLISKYASEWLKCQLEELGHKRGKEFWKRFKHLYSNGSDNIGPVRNSQRQLICEEHGIASEFKRTFFEAHHMGSELFDEDPTRNCENFTSPDEFKLQALNANFTNRDLDKALQELPSCNSFDNDVIHPNMLRHFGPSMKLAILELFNECWNNAEWLWSLSRISFLRKPNKESYDICSNYRPLSISSHIGKLFQRMIDKRLRAYFADSSLIDEEQEGFQPKHSTTRSLYRMHRLLEDAKKSKLPSALFNIDLEKAFDSIWIDGLLFKLRKSGVCGKMYDILKTFLKQREAYIVVNNIATDKFHIPVGLPQGSVLSPILFIFYLSDFLSEVSTKFKFADDSSALVSAPTTQALSLALNQICDYIHKWCKNWRMMVNGLKTEILLFNCNESDLGCIILNSQQCCVKTVTKSLGLFIDNNLQYKEHTSKAISKARKSWAFIRSKCCNKWGLSIPTKLFLYKTVIRPQLLYAAPIWAHKNLSALQKFQNSVIRTIFRHSYSPNISACEVLLGIPPIDIYCSSIDVKFILKSVYCEDHISQAHYNGLGNLRSLANILESKKRRYQRLNNEIECANYTKESIDSFIQSSWNSRWKSTFNECSLKQFVKEIPSHGVYSPLTNGNPYRANKLCELFIGNSLKLPYYAWNLSKIASPLCTCGKEEGDSLHYFFRCANNEPARPSNIKDLNIFNPDDCATLKSFICETEILDR